MKNFLLVFLFLLTTTLAFSQDSYYGIRGGLNITNLDFEPNPTFNNSHRNGLFFGGFVGWYISDNTSILAELQYSAEGAKPENLRADYIQLPVLLRFHLGERFTIGIGPMLSLKTWSFEDNFSTFVASGVGGIEYMITDRLFIDARINYGLTNILDEVLTPLEAKNTAIQFGFGVKI